jgi:hypothetical protein
VVTIQVAGATEVVFISGHVEDWVLNETVCVDNSGVETQGTVSLIEYPAVYLTMDIPIDGIMNNNDVVTVCKGACDSTSSESSQGVTSTSESSSSAYYSGSSSSSLGECESANMLVIGVDEVVFISGHAEDWGENDPICLTINGSNYAGFIRLISGRNVFLTMDMPMTGIINNGDRAIICEGPCSSSSSFGYSSSSSSLDSSSSSSSSEGFSESSSSSEGFSESSSSSS